MRLEKNIAFNELIYFDLKELKKPLKNIIIIIKAPELPIILLGGFILEDFEEEEIGDTIEVLPPSLPERLPEISETSKERSAAPAPALPTPRATVSPEPAPAAGSVPPAAGTAPAEPAQPSEMSTVSKPTREIFGDPEDPRNIIQRHRTRKPASRPGDLPTVAFLQAFSLGIMHQDPGLHRDRLPPPPRNWRELLNHPHRDGFTKAV